MCRDSWGCKESDMTERLNRTELTRQTLVDKVMSLLFNMLSRVVKTFLPRSKNLLISCLQPLSWHNKNILLLLCFMLVT